MTSPAPVAGALQIAAALVFHLPGARLELTGRNGFRLFVGPMTDPRCTLHPAEFRELVVATGNYRLLGTMLGVSLSSEPTMTLVSSVAKTDHLGGGLYRIVGDEVTAYAFATSLPAEEVDSILSGLHASSPREGRTDASAPCRDSAEPIGVSLVRDEGLHVTFVAMSSDDAAGSGCVEAVAEAAVSACLVTEMELLSSCVKEAAS